MPTFKMPLSGDVAQVINPWTAYFSPVGSQFGLVNINMGLSGKPEIEAEVLSDIASYGRQLGRIGDVLSVLLDHFSPSRPLTPAESTAIADLRAMLAAIHKVKHKHGGTAHPAGETAPS
jgi:hypothetical protein